MSQYRLHIDIPLALTEEESVAISKKIINVINIPHFLQGLSVTQINYRLGHDDDRQKSNYLEKTENGHVTNKKCRIDLTQKNSMV
jgi:hypothetical protein